MKVIAVENKEVFDVVRFIFNLNLKQMNKKLKELKETIMECLIHSIRQVYKNDSHLLYNKVSERCVCARLAYYLEQIIHQTNAFEGYYVDVEYDRMEDGFGKRIGLGKKKHICDLLIHSRGLKKPDNLLALEMKVHDNYTKAPEDRERLYDLVQHSNKKNKGTVCETVYGVFLRLRNDKFIYQTFDVEIDGGKASDAIEGTIDD